MPLVLPHTQSEAADRCRYTKALLIEPQYPLCDSFQVGRPEEETPTGAVSVALNGEAQARFLVELLPLSKDLLDPWGIAISEEPLVRVCQDLNPIPLVVNHSEQPHGLPGIGSWSCLRHRVGF